MFKKMQTGTILSALTVLSLGVMATVAVAEPVKESVSKTTTKTVTKAKTDAKAKVATKTTKAKVVKKKVAAKKVKKGSRALERFKSMDSNKNGTISEGEFVAFHKAQFKKKDKNKDSKLTKAEVSPTLAKMKK